MFESIKNALKGLGKKEKGYQSREPREGERPEWSPGGRPDGGFEEPPKRVSERKSKFDEVGADSEQKPKKKRFEDVGTDEGSKRVPGRGLPAASRDGSETKVVEIGIPEDGRGSGYITIVSSPAGDFPDAFGEFDTLSQTASPAMVYVNSP